MNTCFLVCLPPCLLVFLKANAHPAKLKRASGHRRSGQIVHGRDHGLTAQHFKQAAHRGGGLLVEANHPAHHNHRKREQAEVRVELHQLAKRYRAVSHPCAAN